MNYDTSEGSCSDCKLELIQHKWTTILFKWLNKCVHPDKLCDVLTPACLADIMDKYKKDICDNDIDRAILCTDDIEPFIKYKYPILRLRYLAEDSDYEKKQYIMTSVLLYHCCIKSHSGVVHEDIWKYMNKYEQEVILKFCERLDDMEITINNVDCAIKEAFDYVRYIQDLSSDDMEPSTSDAHANTACETEKTPIKVTSSEKLEEDEKQQTLTFNSSVTVLPSAITDTSTFSSLVTEEESSSSCDQVYLYGTDSDETQVYQANEFAEERSHKKPYYSVPPQGGMVYNHKEKHKVQIQKTHDAEQEEHGKQTQQKKAEELGRKRQEYLVNKQKEILARNQWIESEMIADDKKHEYAPIRHENIAQIRRSNENQRGYTITPTPHKNEEFSTIRHDFGKGEKPKFYDEVESPKHHSPKSGLTWLSKRQERQGGVNKVFSAETKHVVGDVDNTAEETYQEVKNLEDCSCSHCIKEINDNKNTVCSKAKKRKCGNLTCFANKKRAKKTKVAKSEQQSGTEQKSLKRVRTEQTSLKRVSKFMIKSMQELQDKAKNTWTTKRYYILIAVGVIVFFILLLTSFWMMRPSKGEKKDDIPTKRYVSTHTPFQYTQKHKWICINKMCQTVYNGNYNMNGSTIYSSFARCTLLCMGPQLWPHPIGYTHFSNKIVAMATNKLEYKFQSLPSETVHQYLGEAFKLFINDLVKLESTDDGSKNFTNDLTVKKIFIQIDVETDPQPRLKMDTEESYNLKIDSTINRIEVRISSPSFCGVRHGLQTLSQMILFDQSSGKLITVSNAVVKDAPSYKYRGLMIDTARNYIPVEDLIRTIDAMASVKLNTFHWRVSDVTSFPLYLPSIPMLFEYGAYTRSMIYTKEDIKFLVERAGIRGVRVLIEIALPGPVGRAWSWSPDANCPKINSDNSTCDNALCIRLELRDSIMNLIETIYSEILEMTHVNDIFHLSDGVFSLANCYSLVEDRKGFLNLALARLKAANKGVLPKLPIIWQSPHLHIDFEAKTWERYGVQLTELPNDSADNVLAKFKVIHSTKWDLSCEIKKQRCTRYRTWQEMYSWKSWRNIEVFSIEGGEAILWTDMVNSGNLDSHLWPRVAAIAERLWSDAVANNSATGPVYVRLDSQGYYSQTSCAPRFYPRSSRSRGNTGIKYSL